MSFVAVAIERNAGRVPVTVRTRACFVMVG